jgi:hypothetical protein
MTASDSVYDPTRQLSIIKSAGDRCYRIAASLRRERGETISYFVEDARVAESAVVDGGSDRETCSSRTHPVNLRMRAPLRLPIWPAPKQTCERNRRAREAGRPRSCEQLALHRRREYR